MSDHLSRGQDRYGSTKVENNMPRKPGIKVNRPVVRKPPAPRKPPGTGK